MEPYEALMDNPLPPQSNPPALPSYQVPPVSFPQFSEGDGMSNSYGNLPGMTGSYPSTPTTPGANMSMGGYNTSSSQQSSYASISSSSSSFSMPYDPPMQGASPMTMPTPPPPTSNKLIYSCTYCGLVLSSNNALIEHKRIHTGERPFVCQICNKRFTQKAHLNIHKRIHTGEKPYPCHICHKRFAQSSHLSSHKRIHTGEKPFVCGICHVGFSQKQRLDAHLKKHMERPGQELNTRINQARQMQMMSAAKMERPEQYRQGLPRDDPNNFMHMVGQGMPYIKQESGVSDIQSNNALRPGMEYKPQIGDKGLGDMAYSQTSDGAQTNGMRMDKTGEDDAHNGDEDSEKEHPDSGSSHGPKMQSQSFSSEGMFLHPSGYVAYGGIEDSEESQEHSPDPNHADSAGPGIQNQGVPGSANVGHRRKPSVVRKRYSESPNKDGEMLESRDVKEGEVLNNTERLQPFNPIQAEGNGNEDEEMDENEDFKDNGEVLDDKNDPPYHGHSRSPAQVVGARRSSSSSTISQSSVETRSHSRRLNHVQGEMMNGDRNAMSSGGTLSYAGPNNSVSNSGLVKINNRISLVNFTADELITHLMKRDDVHRCQFCCLIFQDAAMYHIHRNMHDKGDIRKCNMCGKTLQDKYDFTAHFLSMHQS